MNALPDAEAEDDAEPPIRPPDVRPFFSAEGSNLREDGFPLNRCDGGAFIEWAQLQWAQLHPLVTTGRNSEPGGVCRYEGMRFLLWGAA